jgi:hypothetical protein
VTPSVRLGGKSVLTMSIVSNRIGTPDPKIREFQCSARPPIGFTSRNA